MKKIIIPCIGLSFLTSTEFRLLLHMLFWTLAIQGARKREILLCLFYKEQGAVLKEAR